MTIIPSIDILDGGCVRLYQGDYDQITDYGDDPERIAADFQEAGASRLHVVDLDAARGGGQGAGQGAAHNRDVISRIRKAFTGIVEVGGGIRSEKDIEQLLDIGVDRLIVGTILARSTETVANWISTYGRVFIGGIDARDGKVKVSGWEEDSGLSAVALSLTAKEIGVLSIVYTNIAFDGTLSGPDIMGTAEVGASSGIPVIVSGGVSGIEDLQRVHDFGSESIVGVITGKAVYEGKIDIREALDRFSENTESAREQLW